MCKHKCVCNLSDNQCYFTSSCIKCRTLCFMIYALNCIYEKKNQSNLSLSISCSATKRVKWIVNINDVLVTNDQNRAQN